MMQQAQMVTTPPVSPIAVNRCKFSIRSLECLSKAWTRGIQNLCLRFVSSASREGGNRSKTPGGNSQNGLTVNGAENQDRISDQQNTLGPHGQRAYVEQVWVHSLENIPKSISSSTTKRCQTTLTWRSNLNSLSIPAVLTGAGPFNVKYI